MKSKKIPAIALIFVLLVCGVFSIATAALSYVKNGESLAADSWIGKPNTSPVKCSGAGCDHSNCYEYSFAVVGDTQCLNYKDAENYAEAKRNDPSLTYETYEAAYMRTLYNWILDNQKAMNIQYVMGLGDITETFSSSGTHYEAEWALAAEAISLLDGKIDYSLVRGNHDISSGFNSYFGKGTAYYNSINTNEKDPEGRPMSAFRDPDKIEDSYRKVIINGTHKYIIFALEYYPSEATVEWLNQMLVENSDYDAIITLHAFLNRDASFLDPEETTTPEEDSERDNWKETVTGGNIDPRTLWETSLSLHSNVKMILSGHVDVEDIVVNQLKGKNGNTVTCMLIDGQTIDKKVEAVGLVAMFYVKADGTVMNVEYISTVRDAANQAAYLKANNQFKIKLDYGNAWTKTEYCEVPSEIYEQYEFGLFLDDESTSEGPLFYYGGYDDWEQVIKAINSWRGIGGAAVSAHKTFYVVLNGGADGKYTYTPSNIQKATGHNLCDIVVDLNNNEFTITSEYMVRYYNKYGDRTPTLTIKNGDIIISGSKGIAVFQNEINDAQYDNSVINLKLEKLNVKHMNTSQASIVETYTGTDAGYKSYVNLTVTDCSFDLTAASGAVTLFKLNGKNATNNNVELKLIGGSVKGATAANTVLYSLNEGEDSASFIKDNNGNYTTIYLNEKVTPAGDYRNGDGVLIAYTTESTVAPYEYTAATANVEETPYGNINPEAYPVDSYPFVIFDSNKVVKGAYATWQDMIGGLNTFLNDTDTAHTYEDMTPYYAVMRKSMTDNELDYSNWAHLAGACIIDLLDNTLTVKGANLFKPANKTAGNTYIEVRNGNIVMTGSSRLIYYASQINNGVRGEGTMDISFTDVNISYASGATRNPLIQGMGGTADITTYAKYTFTNCTIDLMTNAPSGNIVFANLTAGLTDSATEKTNHVAQIIVDGGTIKANNANFTFASFNAGEDSVTFVEKDGALTTKIVVPTGTACPSSMNKVNNGGYTSTKTNAGSTEDEYTICKTVKIEGYGTIPIIYDDIEKYPFILFKNNNFRGAYADWYNSSNAGVIKQAIGICSAETDTISIVLRRDYYHDNRTSHCGDFYKMKGTINVDLGGHKMYSVREIMKFNLKGYANTIEVNVTNGSIIVTERALMGISTQDQTNRQTLNLKFSNVNIIYRSVDGSVQHPKIFQTDNADFPGGLCTANITFEKCKFDFSQMKLSSGSSYTMFICATDSKLNNAINTVLDGGEIIGSTKYTLILATLNTENAVDTLTFSNQSGSFTSFKLPTSEAAPTNTYNSSELSFVKISEDNGWVRYTLLPTKVVNFVPKSSITLGSDLVYNIYIPVVDYLVSFTVDGKSPETLTPVTLDDGKQYYHVSVALSAAESARSIVLRATTRVDGKDYNGTFTMSIPKYSKKVIADGTDIEKTLVKDVLAYIKAAYVYFDTEDKAEVVSAIDEILGDYSNAFAKVDGTTDVEDGLWGVVILLEEKPTVRFVLPEGVAADGYTFKSGNTTLKYTVGTMTIGENTHYYAEVSLFAYQMIKEITYSNGINSGIYHLNSYYDFVTTDEEHKTDANLITLVEKLYNYCKSAEAYRVSVTTK